MRTKEFALGVILPIVIGVLPWVLEKRGVDVPTWIVTTGGIVAIGSLPYLFFFPVRWVANGLWKSRSSVTAPSAIAIGAVCVFAGLMAAFWITGNGNGSKAAYDAQNEEWGRYKYDEVINARYANQIVDMDGRRFHHCQFSNVTFQYNGTAPTEMESDNVIIGGIFLHSTNPVVKMTIELTEHAFITLHPELKSEFSQYPMQR